MRIFRILQFFAYAWTLCHLLYRRKKKIKKKEKKNAIVRAVDHAIDQEKSKF